MVGASADVITIEQILLILLTGFEEAIAPLAPAVPVIAAVIFLLALLGIAAYGISHAISADKKDDANIKERAKEALEESNSQSQNANPNPPDDDDDDDPFNKSDAETLSKMTRKELKENMPDDWEYQEHNGRVHIKDSNQKIRIRIDEPETKPPARTPYRHMHVFDENGNSLDIDGNIVPRDDPAGHIPYTVD